MSSRRRKDSKPFLLSQRSNGLLFSHHHFLSNPSSAPPRRQNISILSQIDGNAPAGPRPKMAVILKPVSEDAKDDMNAPRSYRQQPVRSLIPPVIPIRKTERNVIRRRRNSSSSTSIKSMTSSLLSRRRRSAMTPTPSLTNIPSEILTQIFSTLSQLDLHSLMLTNTNFIELAATYLYATPTFVSTYRFAQFIHTIAHKPHYALQVRHLDLSYFHRLGTDPVTNELVNLCGWREFKWRHHDMYWVRHIHTINTKGQKYTTHPPASPFLKSYHRTRDVPIGGLCHVLKSCTQLRRLNLSRLQLGADFAIKSSTFKPTTTHGQIFVSDVPKSHTWESKDLMPVHTDDIIKCCIELQLLESIKFKECVWLSTIRVAKLLDEAPRAVQFSDGGLRRVDFRESGMNREVRWAVRGSREDVEKIVKEVVENTRDRDAGP
ncbi:hypothetical protein B0J14DRAFT_597850 [Halenospora varia]|nr:hypothetical protein B0J14DRAFT_597850 [Halenospora varia]